MRLYKFLNEEYSIKNITKRRLKISRIDQLNDPFEFLAVDMEDSLHAEVLSRFKQNLITNYGIVCFSKTWRNPLLWGHYANSHKGIALGFDVADDKIFEVRYTSERVKPNYDQTARKIVNGEIFTDDLVRTRFIDWKYEEEVRLFFSLAHDNEEDGCYFTEFSSDLLLVEIILGGLCTVPVSTFHDILKTDFPPGTVRLLKAKMDLKKFEIVEDHNF